MDVLNNDAREGSESIDERTKSALRASADPHTDGNRSATDGDAAECTCVGHRVATRAVPLRVGREFV
jgi:hypothetical protein